MSITIDGHRIVANIEVKRISGQAGLGFSILLFHFRAEFNAWPDSIVPAVSELSGVVKVARLAERSSEQDLGFLRPFGRIEGLRAMKDFPNKPEFTMALELDRYRMAALEGFRLGDGLVLKGDLTGQLAQGSKASAFSAPFQHSLTLSDWSQVLSQTGFGRTIVFEVPIPDVVRDEPLARAVGYLDLAKRAMDRGAWREAVGGCRDVFEALQPAVETCASTSARVTGATDREEFKTKPQRFGEVCRALKKLTHAARHVDDIAESFQWERADAVFLLAATSALVYRLRSL